MLKKKYLGLLLIAALVFLPAACKTKEESGLTLGAGKNLKNLIVKEAAGFFVFNMKAIANKGLLDEFTKDAESQKKMKEFNTKFGIDLKKDLELGMVVLLNLPAEPGVEEKDLYIIFTGAFDQDKMVKSLKTSTEVKVEELNELGYRIYHIVPSDSPADEVFLTFKDKSMILAAMKKEHLLTACLLADGKKPDITKGSKLADMFDKVDKDQMFWGLFSIPEEKMSSPEGPAAMFPAFSDIKYIYFGGSYDGKVLFIGGNLFTSKPESIKQLTGSLNSMKEMIKGFASQSPDSAKAIEIIDSINITSEKDSVRITFSLTKDQLELMKSEGLGMGPR